MASSNNIIFPDSSEELNFYIKNVKNIKHLSFQEEQELFKKYHQANDLESVKKIVVSYLYLVVKVAYKYNGYGIPMMDLISEGNIGLMKAVKKFDYKKGLRLSTYAVWWIKAGIQEFILKSWSMVKVASSNEYKKLFFNLKKIKNKILKNQHSSLSDNDYKKIANELGVKKNQVIDMDSMMSNLDVSLDATVENENGEITTMLDNILDEKNSSIKDDSIQKQDLEQKMMLLKQAMQILNQREKEIFIARKLQEKPTTLLELSGKFKISCERVRQIEKKTFEKIQLFMLQSTE